MRSSSSLVSSRCSAMPRRMRACKGDAGEMWRRYTGDTRRVGCAPAREGEGEPPPRGRGKAATRQGTGGMGGRGGTGPARGRCGAAEGGGGRLLVGAGGLRVLDAAQLLAQIAPRERVDQRVAAPQVGEVLHALLAAPRATRLARQLEPALRRLPGQLGDLENIIGSFRWPCRVHGQKIVSTVASLFRQAGVLWHRRRRPRA